MEKQRFAELLVNVMQTQPGREFIYELLDTMEVHVPNYVVGRQSVMGYEIGRRSVGEELLRMLRDDTEEGLQLELLMRQEARDRPKEKHKDEFYDQFEGGNV